MADGVVLPLATELFGTRMTSFMRWLSLPRIQNNALVRLHASVPISNSVLSLETAEIVRRKMRNVNCSRFLTFFCDRESIIWASSTYCWSLQTKMHCFYVI